MHKSSVVRLWLAFLLAGAMWFAYSQGGPQPAKLDLVKIKDDLYVIHNDVVPGNSTALITNEGVVLVDDKFEVDHDNMMAQLKKVTDKPVRYVINTHHHGDHSGGNVKMQQMNAQVVASEEARQNMVDGKQPGLPTVAIEHHAHIYLSGKNAELYHFESKTRGYQVTPDQQARFMRETHLFQSRWPALYQQGDPYYSPNLTRGFEDFSLGAPGKATGSTGIRWEMPLAG